MDQSKHEKASLTMRLWSHNVGEDGDFGPVSKGMFLYYVQWPLNVVQFLAQIFHLVCS